MITKRRAANKTCYLAVSIFTFSIQLSAYLNNHLAFSYLALGIGIRRALHTAGSCQLITRQNRIKLDWTGKKKTRFSTELPIHNASNINERKGLLMILLLKQTNQFDSIKNSLHKFITDSENNKSLTKHSPLGTLLETTTHNIRLYHLAVQRLKGLTKREPDKK